MAEQFTPIKKEDLPPQRVKIAKVGKILQDFLDSGLEAAEWNWKETSGYKSVAVAQNSVRPVLSRNKDRFPIQLVQRKDQLYFFIKKEEN